MDKNALMLIEKLEKEHSLSLGEYKYIIENLSDDIIALLAEKAVCARKKIYKNHVYIRGLIEISNICKNDCYYCGIRRSNTGCDRYRLTLEEILSCCRAGYELGFRTFVLQDGEDIYFSDDVVCDIVSKIKKNYPDCAVTLSLGERSKKSYQRLYDAGADRYLLRHETADGEHYSFLHPDEMSFKNRIECLKNLKEIGYQVGCGFMVGSPGQKAEHLAKDLKFIEEFKPDMCGIGPFVPHHATKYADEKTGSAELTCALLSIIRLISPNILLPSTTALGTILADGRERGILVGANVVMPNLSPETVRKKYELYNNKISEGLEAAEQKDELTRKMKKIGYEIVTHRGDIKKVAKKT